MHLMGFRNTLSASLLLVASLTFANAQRPRPKASAPSISTNILLRILRAEDQRRWDDNLKSLLADKDAKVRKRAALAAGRIGDERAVPAVVDLLKTDPDVDVRRMAAFAIGETESPAGADLLIEVLGAVARLRGPQPGSPARVGQSGWAPEVNGPVRARAVEALGKIAAALPEADKDRRRVYGAAILEALRFEAGRRSLPDRMTILLGLTAVLRAKPEGAAPVIVRFLGYADPRIVADALNTMARLRLKDNNEEVRRLLKHADPIVRANAARVIGAAEDKGAFEALLDRALHDDDLRVRVSAIRALGSLKDERAVGPLMDLGKTLLSSYQAAKTRRLLHPNEVNELLEIATAVGRLLQGSNNKEALAWLRKLRKATGASAPEVELAFARANPKSYLIDAAGSFTLAVQPHVPGLNEVPAASWRQQASIAQGLAELANSKDEQDKRIGARFISPFLRCRPRLKEKALCFRLQTLAVSDYLRAYAAFKPADQAEVLRQQFTESDVIIRATAAELMGSLPAEESNTHALIEALPPALRDNDLNDAALAILDALAKQKSAAANEALKTALDSSDHLIRRKAVALLKANGAGDFSNRIGYVQTRNTEADYRRAIVRIGKRVTATVVTSKGSFTIEFLPEDAPLTVDNFVMLARKGYFNGQTVPRVVPNFVIQTGDPRGDQNGGPGYSIRCEINEVPYDRAAVGMALSGKDTGGSQWFVTHSPQPHLDGGYTVFGRVISGMEVVDRIARGDTIRRVIVNER